MSEFADGMAQQLATDISNLLDDGASADPSRWGEVWPLLATPAEEQSAIRLIIQSVLRVAAGFKYRFLQPLASWHLQLLRFVSRPADVVDDARQTIATIMKNTDECCLKDPLSDIAWKTKAMFKDELEVVSQCGKVPCNLYGFLLVWRAELPSETQCIEGLTSIVTTMGKVSPSLKVPRASDRLSVKFGDPISAEECCDLNASVLTHMQSEKYTLRFAPASTANMPHPVAQKVCNHEKLKYSLAVLGLVSPLQRELQVRADYVFTLKPMGDDARQFAFVVAWSYGVQKYICEGYVDNARDTFTFCQPLVIDHVKEVIATCVRDTEDHGDGGEPPASGPEPKRRKIVTQEFEVHRYCIE
eukprot:325609-Pyramimonas_sp.AAC.1